MDYQKLDGALASLLHDHRASRERLSVFIRTQPQLPADARSVLQSHGIDAPGDGTVFTADLSSEQVASLSEQPWVQSIKLARATRPL